MNDFQNNYIYGRKPILEALQERPNEVEKIFIRTNIQPNSIMDITDLAKANSVPLSRVPDVKIQNLVGRVNDQGVVALLSEIKYQNFFDWFENLDLSLNPMVLLLDGIEDPHNFGAILRTAAAAGVSAVLVPAHKQSPVNATVFKTSAGTAGRIPIIRIHDAQQAMKDLEIASFEIVALDDSGTKTIWEDTFDAPTAFLIGNEGRGIDNKILKNCNRVINIPMENRVESLNASVSTALVCYEWKRKRSVV